MDYPVLAAENEAIRRVCRHYGKLGFSGITVRIDGEIRGYAMGCGISESTLVFSLKGRPGDPRYLSLPGYRYGSDLRWPIRLGKPGGRLGRRRDAPV